MGPGSAILVYVQNLSAVLNDPSGAVPINFYPLFFSDNKGVWLSSTKLCLISQAFCIEIDLGLGDAVAKKYSRQMNMKREKIDRMEAQFFAFAFVVFPPSTIMAIRKVWVFISDLIGVVALKRAGWFRIMCDESVLRPWQLSRTSWGGGQPGCWGGLHPGQW